MHGTLETIDDRPALRFERRLAHPVDAVQTVFVVAAPLAAVAFVIVLLLPEVPLQGSGEPAPAQRPAPAAATR